MRTSKTGSSSEIGQALKADHALLETSFRCAIVKIHCGEWDVVHPLWLRVNDDLAARIECEEELLLPLFEQDHPQEAARIRREHGELRAALQRLSAELDSSQLDAAIVDAFLALLRAHAESEESCLYPWAQRQLTRQRKQAVYARLRSLLRARSSLASLHAL